MKAPIIAICLSLLIYSCAKEPPVPDPDYPWWGEATATENGTAWKGKPYAVISRTQPDRVSILIDSLANEYYPTKGLSFYRFPLFTGTYKVLDNNASEPQGALERAKYYYVDVDVLYGVYKVLESDSTNALSITSYDSVSREIKGTFNVTFVQEHAPYPGAPDTIRFRDGKFHTRIIQ